MIYIAIGAAVLALLVWVGRRAQPSLKRGEVRIAAGVMSALAIGAAGFLALRGGWLPGLLLGAAGLASAFAARMGGQEAPPPPKSNLGLDEARSILGVGPNATPDEIQAAYTRLMRLAHPDKGGTSGLAAQLNAARDRLLRR
jgi:hypothetical protein